MGLGIFSLKRLCEALASALLFVAVLASDVGAPRAQDGETAEEVFRDYISEQIVQTKCVNCHVVNGLSGHTRLVFVRRSADVDYEALNLQTFENFLAEVDEEGAAGGYILLKIQGALGHGGREQVPAGSTEFANMQRFLAVLGEELEPPPSLTAETLFDTVIMASPRKTLRRTALIFAGRIPTETEYAAVEGGDESALRATIRGLMEGPEFHEFLIRASNDRLLTDRNTGRVIDSDSFIEFTKENYRRRRAAHIIDNRRAWDDYYLWRDRVDHGARRAPLELIAYVVENDLPYTEILTADYIMANPWAAAAYGASTRFDDPEDPYEFKPSRIVSYYRRGEGYEAEYDRAIGATRIIDPGPLSTDYPHAGILNTTVFLQRYPTTATNRNRARSRWTYYHFLGLDVEKSASRTTDPEALKDTNNPTMHNPNCTVCHSVLDPVAGAFQNYGDGGFYRDQWGGMDSLDQFYKDGPEQGAGFEITARSFAERQTVLITAWLQAGTETIRTRPFFDPPRAEGSDIWWNPGIDHVTVRNVEGEVVAYVELARLEKELDLCGTIRNHRDAGEFFESHFCTNAFLFELPTTGYYDIEVSVWIRNEHDDVGDERKLLSVGAGGYMEGDTWYRDMRNPGFVGAAAPHPDNSVQWLARQIVADNRFAEAAVNFWWPAIMGSEIAEFPEDAADADFEGRLLAASAQDEEVVRLADGFQDGFPGSSYTYNLKDLLVEIVLSKWFRADAVTDTDPVRRVALRDAGARRLLTPEELARKTGALTGFQWGRHIRTNCWPRCERIPNALTGEFRLLYGGIDSDGITERARDITSVMAGVAKRHAAQASCPVVMREVYLLPDAERRLFAGIDPYVTPASEFSDTFEITAASRSEMETLALQGHLTAGEKTVLLAFLNDYKDALGNRNVLLDRLTVRQGATVVYHYEIETLAHRPRCHHVEQGAFHLSNSGRGCVLAVPVDIPADGTYEIEVSAWGTHAGDELPRLFVGIDSDAESSAGAASIRNKLVELYDKLLGVQVAPDSPDVEATYRLFVAMWQRGRDILDGRFDFQRWNGCSWHRDHFFFEGILDGAVVEHENERGHRYLNFDWDRVDDFLDGVDFSDPHHTVQAWVIVLAAMMMDYRYLYLN